jgi:diacylglycerol O-acyltransferase 1
LVVREHGFVLAYISEAASFSVNTWEQKPFVSGLLATQVFLLVAFVTEWMLGKNGLYEPVGMIVHQLNAHASFAVSVFIVWNFIENPAVGGVLLLTGAITWMKLISYALANQDYRQSKGSKDNDRAALAIIDNLDANDWNIEYPV